MTRHTRRIAFAAVIVVGSSSAAHAQVFKTGAFNKITTATTQTISHGLGETPKALILWTSGSAVTGTNAADQYFSFGFSDGPTSCGTCTSKSVSMGSLHDAPNASSRRRMANKVLTISFYDGVAPLAEADLQSWDATTFTLNWTTNTTPGSVIHFIAIGGAGVSAKVKEWTSSTTLGNQTVSGIGFQPDVVIHGHIDHGAAPPVQAGHAMFGLGAMDSDGNQWAVAFRSIDGAGTSDTARVQHTDATIRVPSFAGSSCCNQARALLPSDLEGPTMTSDGFIVKWTNVFFGAREIISLALSGISVKAGKFDKVTSGATQSVSGVGFQPTLVMLASFHATTLPNANMVAHARLGVGAADGAIQGYSGFTDTNGLNRTVVLSREDTANIFLKSDNQTLAIEAAATLSSFDTDGFTLNWGPNDGVATEMLYLALAPFSATAVDLTAFGVTRYDGGVLVEWRTGYEISNLGFHVYREIDGQRTRVTPSLVAGTGLRAGQGTMVAGEQRYAIWDVGFVDPSAVYWLEDVDFNGKSRWHGPATPVDGGLQPPDVVVSSALRDIGKGTKRRGRTFLSQGARLGRTRDPGPRAVGSAQLESQRALASNPTVKIGVNRPGWYRVAQPDLVAAGLDPGVDPRALRLFADGLEQAITVVGEADGRFDASDAVEFYGTGIDTPFTDTRVYWLVADTRPGRRIVVRAPAPRGAHTTAASFAYTVQQKERTIYFASLVNGDAENWFGSLIHEEPTELSFDISNVDLLADANLELTLQGITSLPDANPDHQVAVLVNGVEIGELRFDSQARHAQSFAIAAGGLRDGANTVTLVARGGEEDYSLVDVVRLQYAHSYRADADRLRFAVEGPGTVTVGGFASPAIRVVDITDASAVEELGGPIGADGAGLSAITLRVPASGVRTLMAFTETTVAAPAFVRANRPSRWHAAAQAADYVAIVHDEFADSIAPLLARRERQGLATARVDVEDLYDEFSFGEKTPQALKDFVRHARTSWKKAPRFLLLVGDATFDPRDYAGFGDADFVPTAQVGLGRFAFETASDDWFADLDDDGVPELAVGRLSIRTAPQAERMVAKILEYETSTGPWTKDLLLVADQNDTAGDFERSSEAVRDFVPLGYSVRQVLRGVLGADAARAEILDAVNRGQLVVNYLGHGSLRVWGKDGRLLTADDVRDTWRNIRGLPFVVAMSCLNGFFYDIYDEESLAETLLRAPEGGAVAAWASSGLTESRAQLHANQELFRVIFQQPELTLGEAVTMAKRAASDRDVRRSWIFFGDPAMRLLGAGALVGPH